MPVITRKTMNSRNVIRLAVVLALCACAPVLLAQEATIVGTITDSTGAVVPNVGITVTNTDTNQSRRVSTNDAGQYVVPGLNTGHYSLRAESTGFRVTYNPAPLPSKLSAACTSGSVLSK